MKGVAPLLICLQVVRAIAFFKGASSSDGRTAAPPRSDAAPTLHPSMHPVRILSLSGFEREGCNRSIDIQKSTGLEKRLSVPKPTIVLNGRGSTIGPRQVARVGRLSVVSSTGEESSIAEVLK